MEKRNVLFVDDEERILHALENWLIDEPYEMLFANSGKASLEILKQMDVHVIVVDMRMPEMDGFELLGIVRRKNPHIMRIALSGYANVDNVLRAVNEAKVFKFITKSPGYLNEIKVAITDALDYYKQHYESCVLAGKMK